MTKILSSLRADHIIILSLCLLIAVFIAGAEGISARDWQEKDLLLPRSEAGLVENFDLLNFSVEFIREDRSQRSIFTFEFLEEEIIEGDELDKFEMSMRREEEEARPFHVWLDSEYTPRRAELDGDETAPESIFMYLEPILDPFIRLVAMGVEDLSEIDFAYDGEGKIVLDGEEIRTHTLTIPLDELEGEGGDDLVLELAEFENDLAVVYYNYMRRDAETVEIEYRVEDLRLQGDQR